MKEVGDKHFGTFEHASRQLAKRQTQVEDLVSRVENFHCYLACWTKEKRQLERQKSELESQIASIESGLDD